uniref:Thrombospondin type 1 domain-containing protein n=1 Tax=Wuchereria bancrofti TaxID=6293 RepID=A0AAF5Q6C9_WUCBA
MKHDSANGCNEPYHIMSISIGTGQTSWSSCHCKVAIPEFTILRHGSSSDWKDGGCVMECVPCQTSGQIRWTEWSTCSTSCGFGIERHTGNCPMYTKVSYLRCYAPMNGMCKEKNSCTISEGHDFSAIFIVAHEIGYNANGCNEPYHIMSISIGTGQTSWSSCHCKVAIPEFTILRHGSSSDWKDGGCVMECVPCQTSGQIRVQRSLRICDNPYGLNGQRVQPHAVLA